MVLGITVWDLGGLELGTYDSSDIGSSECFSDGTTDGKYLDLILRELLAKYLELLMESYLVHMLE